MFKGWALNGDEENLYSVGSEVGTDKAGSDYAVRLKAVYGKPPADVKYAVSIYGIAQDEVNIPGKVAALTFGPATGENYTGSFNSCGSPDCIHNLSWEQIIEKANEDPTVFESCLRNGCTHSVELNLSNTIKGTSYQNMTGDGVSSLKYSIKSDYQQLNTSSLKNFEGGWPASRIRTTLNGKENCTPYTKSAVAGSNLLSENDALISAFPEELKQAIVPKIVRSDVTSSTTDQNIATYDKLWLFSTAELFPKGQQGTKPNEGADIDGCCQRSKEFGITLQNYAKLISCNEKNEQNGDWYTRSLSAGTDNKNAIISSSKGIAQYSSVSGIAPGFCIGTVDTSTEPTAVIYYDGTMIFYEGKPDLNDNKTHNGTVGNAFGYTGWNKDIYSSKENIPWRSALGRIQEVTYKGTIIPKSTAYWFYDASRLKNVILDGLKTEEVTDMSYMFYNCISLEELEASTWDTGNVTNMSGMFYSCQSLNNLNVQSWDTKNVTNMKHMFRNCQSLNNLNIREWDTTHLKNTMYMFYNCLALTSLDLSGWNIKNADEMDHMFAECTNLQSLDLSSWGAYIISITNNGGIDSLFEYDNRLETIYAGDWTQNRAITYSSNVFSRCESLPGYDDFDTSGRMCKPQSMGGFFTDPIQ